MCVGRPFRIAQASGHAVDYFTHRFGEVPAARNCVKIMAHKNERELAPVIAAKHVVLVPDNALKLSVP